MQPERVDAELLKVIEPLRQTNEVADAVSIAVLQTLERAPGR